MQSSSAAAGKLPRCELLSSPVISERADANIKSQTYTTISICIGIAFELSSGPLMIPIRIIYNSKFPFVRIYNFLSQFRSVNGSYKMDLYFQTSIWNILAFLKSVPVSLLMPIRLIYSSKFHFVFAFLHG